MHRINHYIRMVLVSTLMAAFAVCVLANPSSGQSRRRDKADKKIPPASARDRIYAQQAKAWSSFYAGKYQQAAKQAGPLLKAPKEWARVQAAHCRARCYWAGGRKQSRAKAKKIWTKLEKSSTLNANLQRLVIAKALMAEADKKDAQAIVLLEGVLKRGFPDTCTAEAAIELGWIYAKVRRFKDAKRAYDFASHFLNYQVKREVPAAAAEPFVSAAKDAKAHLKYLEDAGREEFEKAETLRKKNKFVAAGRLYRQIIKKYPAGNYTPRSELHLGHCLLGMKQGRRAVAHWKKFIQAAPAGPWRGQAYVGLIDLYLEHLLDLDQAGEYAELARNSLSTAMSDKKSGKSWKAAAFDIYLRIGIVAFAQEEGQAATDAFAQARRHASRDRQGAGLKALIAAAKSGKPITPEDVRDDKASKKVALALSMGVIHNLACGFEHAEILFERVLKNEIRGGSAAQLSFATFGQAASLEGRKKLTKAKAAYLASAKNFPKGTWHDETLYRVASIVQHNAWEKHAKEPEDAKASDKSKIRNPKSAIRNAKADEEKAKRHKEYLKARGAALPYWMELIKRYPKSPRVEPAMYNVGILLCEGGHWNPAAERLADFVKAWPKSYFAGDAYVRLIDISLERKFELVDARAYAAAAVEWAKASSSSIRNDLPPWALSVTLRPTTSDLRPVLYEVYLRAGLVAYLDQKYDQATEMFTKGDKYDTSDRRDIGLETCMERLIKVVRGKMQSMTPPDLIKQITNDHQKTAILLADLYLLAFQPEIAERIYRRLMSGDDSLPKPDAEVEAYLLWRMGQTLEFLKKHDEAIACLKRLTREKYAKYPWAAEGIFRIAVWSYNHTQDVGTSMPYYKIVFSRFPKHPQAIPALFLYGLDAYQSQKYREARKAFLLYKERYPNTRWSRRVEEELLPETKKRLKEKKR